MNTEETLPIKKQEKEEKDGNFVEIECSASVDDEKLKEIIIQNFNPYIKSTKWTSKKC